MRCFPLFAVSFRALFPLLGFLITLARPVFADGGIEGTVVLSTGAPVAGATVYGASPHLAERPTLGYSPCVTDSQGRFVVNPFYGMADFDGLLVVVPPRIGVASNTAVTFVRIKTAGPHRITLAPATQHSVRFTDGNDAPLANRRVLFWREFDFRSRHLNLSGNKIEAISTRFPLLPPVLEKVVTARTDAKGILRVRMARNARYSVTVDAAPGRLPPPLLSRPLVTGDGPVSTQSPFRLSLKEVRWGTVTHRTTGRPLAGAQITLFAPGGAATPLSAVTSSDGRYRFTDLYPGEFFVHAAAPHGYLIAESLAKTPRPTLRLGEENIVAVRATTVVVQVRDSSGRPVFGQKIGIERKLGTSWYTVEYDRQPVRYTDWMGGICGTRDSWTIRTDVRGQARFSVPLTQARLIWNRASDYTLRLDSAPDEKQIVALQEGEIRRVYFGPDPSQGSGSSPFAPAPDVTALDADGKTVRLSDFRGTAVVVDVRPWPGLEWLGKTDLGTRGWDTVTQQLQTLTTTSKMASLHGGTPVIALALLLDSSDSAEVAEAFRREQDRLAAQYPGIRFLRVPAASQGVRQDSPVQAYVAYGQDSASREAYPQRYIIGPDGTLRGRFSTADRAALNDPKTLERAVIAAGKP